MPEGFRNGVFALGLMTGFAGLLLVNVWLPVGFDWWVSNVSTPDQSRYAQEQCERQKQGQSTAVPPAVNKSKSVAAGENDSQQEAGQSYNPDWCDLAAQQASAQAAVGMERSAWWNTGLTLIGVLLIGGTLYFTSRAAKDAERMVQEAKKATAAANCTIDVTREIGQAQVRAYVNAASGSIEEMPNGSYDFVVTIKNTGLSPAKDVYVVGICELQGLIVPDKIERFPFFHEDGCEIGSGMPHELRVNIKSIWIIMANQAKYISNRELRFSGSFRYTDVFKETGTGTFAFTVGAGDEIRPGSVRRTDLAW